MIRCCSIKASASKMNQGFGRSEVYSLGNVATLNPPDNRFKLKPYDFCPFITSIRVVQSFSHFAKSTKVLMSYTMPKTITVERKPLLANKILPYLRLMWFSVGFQYCIAPRIFNPHKLRSIIPTLENPYGFWPQTGCVTVPGREAVFLVARQRFPCRSRFNFSVKNMENMLPCNAICDIMHIDFSRNIYIVEQMMHPLVFNLSSLSQMKAHKIWKFGMFWDILRQ